MRWFARKADRQAHEKAANAATNAATSAATSAATNAAEPVRAMPLAWSPKLPPPRPADDAATPVSGSPAPGGEAAADRTLLRIVGHDTVAKPSGAPMRLEAMPPRGGAPASAPPRRGDQQPFAQKALYKQLMNGFYDAILITDGKGHVLDSNVRAPEFFGYTNDELWDMPVADMVAGLNEAVYERIRRALGGERYVLMNTRCTRKDGTCFPAEVGISVIAMLGKEDFVLTVRNVERRAAQLHSLRSGHNAFMNAQSGCFVADADGHLLVVNSAFLALLRIAPDSPVAGVPVERFVPGVAACFQRVAGGDTVTTTVSVGAGESVRTLTVVLAPNRQGSAPVDGIVGSLIMAPPTGAAAPIENAYAGH